VYHYFDSAVSILQGESLFLDKNGCRKSQLRKTEIETETDRQIDRQTQIDRQRQRERERERERERNT